MSTGLLRLGLALVAATALGTYSAGSATATSPVKAIDDATEQHCGEVAVASHEVSGSCTLVATSEAPIELEGELFGFHIHEDDCNIDFAVTLGEQGNGYASDFSITSCSAGIHACEEPAGNDIPWPASSEEVGSDTVEVALNACLDTATLGECSGHLDLTVTYNAQARAYEAVADGQAIGSSPCEVDAHWLLTDADLEGTSVDFAGHGPQDTGVELVNEVTGAHCGDVSVVGHDVSGGCEVVATGDGLIEFEAEIFGFHIHEFDCENVFDVNFDESGARYVSGFQILNCELGITACAEQGGGEPPWSAIGEEVGPNTVEASLTACIVTETLGRCSGAFDLTITEANETYEASADGQAIGNSPCEIDGSWFLDEANPTTTDLHITHL